MTEVYQSSAAFHCLLGKAVEQSALRRPLLTPKEMLARISLSRRDRTVLPHLCTTDTHWWEKWHSFGWLEQNVKSPLVQNILLIQIICNDQRKEAVNPWRKLEIQEWTPLSSMLTVESSFSWHRIFWLALLFHHPCRTAGIFGRALEQLPCQRGRSAVRWSGAGQGLVLMCW